MIVIVDYRMGNLGSLKNMLGKIGAECMISSEPEVIAAADKLILPGVGSFDNAMTNIRQMGLETVLNQKVIKQRTPLLGICLGMQLLARSSEEGVQPGLGWIDAKVVRFNFAGLDTGNRRLTIPHMGWNSLTVKTPDRLFADMEPQAMFYFVHSYHFCCDHPQDSWASSFYGYEFTAVAGRENIIGAQFHPEKSLRFGKQLLTNFCNGGIQ